MTEDADAAANTNVVSRIEELKEGGKIQIYFHYVSITRIATCQTRTLSTSFPLPSDALMHAS
jgi:hypothetical protein